MYTCTLNHVRLFAPPWTVAVQAPLSVGFSRQEYWSGCHFLLQGIFPTQGSNPCLLHCRWIIYLLSHWGRPNTASQSSEEESFFLPSAFVGSWQALACGYISPSSASIFTWPSPLFVCVQIFPPPQLFFNKDTSH